MSVSIMIGKFHEDMISPLLTFTYTINFYLTIQNQRHHHALAIEGLADM